MLRRAPRGAGRAGEGELMSATQRFAYQHYYYYYWEKRSSLIRFRSRP